MRIDEFDLFTFSYFCIPFEQIAAFLQQQWGNNEKYRLQQTPFKFDLFDKSPQKGGAHFEKAYFFVPKHHRDKCIMVSNYADGLTSWVYRITEALSGKAYSFCLAKDKQADTMNAFCCIERGQNLRTVYAMKDPKWTFYSQGAEQFFEEAHLYQQKLIRKRINKHILITYCARLGLDITDDLFWKSEQSILVERIAW